MRVSTSAFDKAKADFYGQLESYPKDIVGNLRKLYPEEYSILKAVASGDTAEVTEYGNEAPDLIDHLIGYGMGGRLGNGFDIKFDAIKAVLRRIMTSEAGEDRWAEISRRRNKLETDIRLALYHWSRGMSAVDWSIIVADCLTKKRVEALATHLFV